MWSVLVCLGCHNKIPYGNSLVVQWLGLGTFTAVGPGWIPGGKIRILQAAKAQPKQQQQQQQKPRLGGVNNRNLFSHSSGG